MSRRIFVFGSNLAGIHGAGSALEARNNHGAVLGCGFGLSGNSFAIPTKDENLVTRDLDYIQWAYESFIVFAISTPHWQYDVVDIGCGLAGYTPEEVAVRFKQYRLPANVYFLGKLAELMKDATAYIPE